MRLSFVLPLLLLLGCAASTAPPAASPSGLSLRLLDEITGLGRPLKLDVSPTGSICLVDGSTDEVILIAPEGLMRFGGSGWRAGEFRSPADVAFNPRSPSQIYVLDSGNGRVQKGDLVEGRFAVVGRGLELSDPSGIDVDPLGRIYIADTGNHRAIRFDPSTGRVIELLKGELERPIDVAVGRRSIIVLDGLKLWICDPLGNPLSRVDLPEGRYSSITLDGARILVLDPAGRLVVIEGGRFSSISHPKLAGGWGLEAWGGRLYVSLPREGSLRVFKLE